MCLFTGWPQSKLLCLEFGVRNNLWSPNPLGPKNLTKPNPLRPKTLMKPSPSQTEKIIWGCVSSRIHVQPCGKFYSIIFYTCVLIWRRCGTLYHIFQGKKGLGMMFLWWFNISRTSTYLNSFGWQLVHILVYYFIFC